MRVAIVCSHYPPVLSPESNHAALLCDYLAGMGIDIHLVTSPLKPGALRPSNFTIHDQIESWRWGGIAQLTRTVARIRPQIVLLIYVGWIYLDHPMITFSPKILKRYLTGVKFITQFENVLGAKTSSTFDRLKWWMVKLAVSPFSPVSVEFGTLISGSDALIALNETHAREIVRISSRRRTDVKVIPAPPLLRVASNEGNASRIKGRQRLGLSDAGGSEALIAYFGYIYPGKGIETLLDAIAILKSRADVGPFKLVLIGSMAHEELQSRLQRQIERLELVSLIHCVGHQVGEAASELLWASDIAVLPFDEGIRANNSSFAVCAAHHLPIITTKGGELEDCFLDRINTLLTIPKSPDGLADAIQELLASVTLRKQLVEGVAKLSESTFSWAKTGTETLELFKSLVR